MATKIAKPTGSYTKIAKPTGTYSKVKEAYLNDWTLADTNAAGGVTLDSTTITLGGRQNPYTKTAKPT